MERRSYLHHGRLDIERIISEPADQNTWFFDKGGEMLVIDPGCDPADLRELIRGKRLLGILITHAHGDHLSALTDWVPPDSSKVVIGPEPALDYAPLVPSRVVHGGERLTFGPFEVHVMATPGHTRGGVSYLIDRRYVCTGDTLFQGDVGFHHLPGGDAGQLRWSVQEVLFKLHPSIAVLPGHGEPSTIGHEQQHNTLEPAPPGG